MQFQIVSKRESRQKDTLDINIRVLKNVFSKQFFLSDAEDNSSRALKRGRIADLP